MSTQPTAERKRDATETQDSVQRSATPAKRSKIWYDDANVVLEAEGTYFKVYRGLLSQSSSVFGDMFTLPQPSSSTEEMIDGCPVIHLSDSRVDCEYVLEALFQRKHLPGKPMPVAIVAAFLRLGTKYDIPVLRAEALEKVYYEFPTTFAAYEVMKNWSMIQDTKTNVSLVLLANLAREHGLQSMLPLALYFYCSLTSIEKGFEEGGSVVQLSSDDLQTCMSASSGLMALQAKTTYAWMYADAATIYKSCASVEICSSIRKNILIREFLPVGIIHGLCHWKDKWKEKMCQKCIPIAKSSHNAGRQKFWDGIPSAFGFPGWAALEKERDRTFVLYLSDSEEELISRN